MHITSMNYYGASRDTICRLGLADALVELQQNILNSEVKDVASWLGSPRLRVFERESAISRIGPRLVVKSLLTTRKELLIPCVLRVRTALQTGTVDVGIIIVPSDRFAQNISKRTQCVSDLLQVIEIEVPEASKVPIVVIAVDSEFVASRTPGATFRHIGDPAVTNA
jgi:hypothetical protein